MSVHSTFTIDHTSEKEVTPSVIKCDELYIHMNGDLPNFADGPCWGFTPWPENLGGGKVSVEHGVVFLQVGEDYPAHAKRLLSHWHI